MFSEIRRRLTLQYAAMMAFFLLTFVLVCFLGVTYLTTTELNQSLRLLAREEAEEQAAIYQHKGMLEGNSEQTKLPDEDFGGQLFYYVFDRQGTLMNSLEPGTAIRQAVLERIAERRLAEGKTDRYDFRLANGHHRTVIITARPILDGQKPIGFLYIGMDVSTQYRLLRNVFFILCSYFYCWRAAQPILWPAVPLSPSNSPFRDSGTSSPMRPMNCVRRLVCFLLPLTRSKWMARIKSAIFPGRFLRI